MAKDSLAKASIHEPVGPGPLWKHKGWQLPAYIQHIANDLREKRGMTESRAIATAIAVVKRWAAGAGNVKPETRAAANKALAEWEALKAKAAAARAGKHAKRAAMAQLSEVEDPIVSVEELSDEDFQMYSAEYLQGGFSPGTANVSAEDYKKLLPMLRYYAGFSHPFAQCFEDYKDEFGEENAARYAGIIKDLIYHSTAWRKGKEQEGKMKPVVLSDFADWEEEEYTDLAKLVESIDPDTLKAQLSDSQERVELAADSNIGILQSMADSVLEYLKVEKDESDRYEAKDIFRRIHNLMAKDRADRALKKAPHPLQAMGMSLSADEPWMGEFFLDAGEADGVLLAAEEDGFIWKTIMREGKWKLSPGPGQRPMAKPITVISKGKSDPAKLIISLAELKKNYEDNAVEHVTIPTSHDNKVFENTGFIRGLRLKKDEKGRTVLEAAHDFTEPDVKGKAERGTIANTSAGVLFDYPRKEDGKRFGAVLEHVALTNRPWLSGMKPFGMAADSEEVKTIVTFSEEVADDEIKDEELEASLSETPAEVEEPVEDKDDVAAGSEADVDAEEATKEGEEEKTELSEEEKAEAAKAEEAKSEEEKEVELADDPKKPYGDVQYADPGYQKDGKKRYPLDSEQHCRAAWSYINQAQNAAQYSSGQLSKIKARIRGALKKYGVKVNMSDARLTRENLLVLLSQEVTQTASEGGVSDMTDEATVDYVERFGLSEDEIEAALEERENLKKSQKKARVEAKLSEWTEDKKSPAILAAAGEFMLADEGDVIIEAKGSRDEEGKISLSEDAKKTVGLTLSDVVEALVELSGSLSLEDKQVSEKDTTDGTKPDETSEEVELSAEVAAEARRLFLYENMSEDEAIAKATAAAKKSE